MTETLVSQSLPPLGKAAQPAAPPPRAALLAPVMPGIATGVPVIDVPMLVEPVGFAEPVGFSEPAAEIRPPAADRRPVRRRFLPPVVKLAGDASERALPMLEAKPAMPRRPPLVPLLVEPAERPAPVVPTGPTVRRLHAAAAATGRGWRRPVLVGVGVAAALCVATLLEVRASRNWLAGLPAIVLQAAARPPLPPAGAPPADPARRVAWYTGRANAGDTDAQVALAVLYAKGDGVTQDYKAAAGWFRRAAEKGVTRAQYDLGVLYEHGRGVPQDPVQAVAWYRKAAAQNHPLAEYNLAVAFTKGEGVQRDPFEAAVWYLRAASQGVVAAMVNLAILYERGEGVDASTADAYAWYRAAAHRGSAPAGRRADELLRAFSSWDQTRAEAKTADVAASIHDAEGERARLAARTAATASPAAASAEEASSTLKSGFSGESRRNSPPPVPAGDNP